MDHTRQAAEYFEGGYNCAQAVAAAFSDLTGFSPAQSAKMVSGFGGGMGRMREVCGAVSGMVFVLSNLYGYETPNQDAQMAIYATVQELATGFQEAAGSMICREILKNPPADPKPTPRTESFYATRPCTRLVVLAAQLLDDYISAHS